MKGLLAWAEKGGMLAAVSNAGSGDRYNTPSTVLSEAAQVTEPPRTRLMFASEDTLPLGSHGTASTLLNPAQSLPFSAFGPASALTTTGSAAKTLAAFEDGRKAVTQTGIGEKNGTIVRFGWLPGVSYWFSHAPNTVGNRPRDDNTRKIIADLAARAGVVPPVVASQTRVETPLLLAPDKQAAVVTLLNFGPGLPVAPIEQLKLSIRLPFKPTAVESVAHGPVAFTVAADGEEHVVALAVPLKFADFVKLS